MTRLHKAALPHVAFWDLLCGATFYESSVCPCNYCKETLSDRALDHPDPSDREAKLRLSNLQQAGWQVDAGRMKFLLWLALILHKPENCIELSDLIAIEKIELAWQVKMKPLHLCRCHGTQLQPPRRRI